MNTKCLIKGKRYLAMAVDHQKLKKKFSSIWKQRSSIVIIIPVTSEVLPICLLWNLSACIQTIELGENRNVGTNISMLILI